MDGDRGVRVRKALIGFVALLLIAQFARTMAAELIPGDPVPIESAAQLAGAFLNRPFNIVFRHAGRASAVNRRP